MHGEDSDYLWTAGKVKNGLTEEEYDAQKKSLFGKTLPIPGSLFDLRQKKLRKALVESVSQSVRALAHSVSHSLVSMAISDRPEPCRRRVSAVLNSSLGKCNWKSMRGLRI